MERSLELAWGYGANLLPILDQEPGVVMVILGEPLFSAATNGAGVRPYRVAMAILGKLHNITVKFTSHCMYIYMVSKSLLPEHLLNVKYIVYIITSVMLRSLPLKSNIQKR